MSTTTFVFVEALLMNTHNIYIYIFFFVLFDLGFMALSRIFHFYRADRSSKVGKNRRTRGKIT